MNNNPTAREIREMAKDIAYSETVQGKPLSCSGYALNTWRWKAAAEGREVGHILGENELRRIAATGGA